MKASMKCLLSNSLSSLSRVGATHSSRILSYSSRQQATAALLISTRKSMMTKSQYKPRGRKLPLFAWRIQFSKTSSSILGRTTTKHKTPGSLSSRRIQVKTNSIFKTRSFNSYSILSSCRSKGIEWIFSRILRATSLMTRIWKLSAQIISYMQLLLMRSFLKVFLESPKFCKT